MSSILPFLLWRRSIAFKIPYSTKASSKPALRLNIVKNSKSKQAVIIKNLHRENKEIFGELLESKQEKVSRAKKLASTPLLSKDSRETVFVAINHQNYGPKSNDVKKMETIVVPLASLQIDATSNISRNGNTILEEKEISETSERNWIFKNSKGVKRLNRIRPTLTSEDVSKKSEENFESQLFVTVSASDTPKREEVSAKELREVPSLKQFLTSLNECRDINQFEEKKITRKNGTTELKKTSDTNLKSLINNYEAEFIDEDEGDRLLHSSKPASSDEGTVTAGTATTQTTTNEITVETKSSPYDLSSESDSNSPLSSDEGMVSAGYKLFPLVNPARLTTAHGSSDLINNIRQIITRPFPTGEKSTILQPSKYPSVTRILSATMPPEQVEILKRWEQKMIKDLGEDGFRKYKEELFRNGNLLHKNIQFLFRGKSSDELEIVPPIQGHWKSLETVLKKTRDTSVLESYVAHPDLGYSGIVDCVATYEDKLVLIDWKTSEKPKPFISNTYDTPLQIAAYIGAINYDPYYTIKVTEGLAVIAYKDGNECQIFHLNAAALLKFWKLWLRRLKIYQAVNK